MSYSTENKARKWQRRKEYLRRAHQHNHSGILSEPKGTRAPATSPKACEIAQAPSQPCIKVHICTFNSCGTVPRGDDLDRLLPTPRPDILAIGLSEFGMSLEKTLINKKTLRVLSRNWAADVQQRLGADQFTLVASRQLQGLLLVVFARVDLPYCPLAVKTDAVATGAGNVVGNKGAVIVKLFLSAQQSADSDEQQDSIRVDPNPHKRVSSTTKDPPQASLTFVQCHLAAHPRNTKRRNQDYERILTTSRLLQHFSRHRPSKSRNHRPRPAHHHHHTTKRRPRVGVFRRFQKLYRRREKDTFRNMRGPVFLFGDLNFRVQCGNRAYCDRLLAMGRFDELLHKRCQLTRQLLHNDDSDDSQGSEESLGEIETVSRAPPWSEWKEAPILFPPTYKFDMGTNVYDTSDKQRIPSWTDRILWRSDADGLHQINCQAYDSISSVKSSDHRPVYASFDIRLGSTDGI
ncbi:inositol [Perkinsus olseni]|uniref:Inositol n=1 Tax=Perkinsus olseni TaxID=32597 RepID=A0A7J6MQE3_PEROL|nr:inositol [Perkinsus olseni]KAF4673828.1 inositol [Perkinsus olseni]